MANINLTQAEADALIAMEKHRVTDERTDFPMGGESVVLPLQSADRRQFLLDLSFMRFCNITRPPNVKQELLT